MIGGSEQAAAGNDGGASTTNLHRVDHNPQLITKDSRIEETKIGFFNPSRYEEQEALFEKAEENQILEAV